MMDLRRFYTGIAVGLCSLNLVSADVISPGQLVQREVSRNFIIIAGIVILIGIIVAWTIIRSTKKKHVRKSHK